MFLKKTFSTNNISEILLTILCWGKKHMLDITQKMKYYEVFSVIKKKKILGII